MTERPRKTDPQQFLSGWKEIANYLGKGVRTVQRYELQLQLPVRRPAGRPWGSVVATKAELDAWVKASPIREVFRLSQKSGQGEYGGYADEIKRGLEKMNLLRDQMYALRSEVRESVQSLRENLYELQGRLNQYGLRNSEFPEESLELEENESEARARDQFDLLTAPTDYPKAS